jgi:hypothetical protein
MKGVNITHGIGRGALASGQIEEGGRVNFGHAQIGAAKVVVPDPVDADRPNIPEIVNRGLTIVLELSAL